MFHVFNNFIYLLVMLVLRCWVGFPLVAVGRSYSLGAVVELLILGLLLLQSMAPAHAGFQSCGAWA